MSAHSLGALKATMLSVHPGIIVPPDDGVELRLHAMHEQESALRPLIDAYPIENHLRSMTAIGSLHLSWIVSLLSAGETGSLSRCGRS